jgi:hypothetical protein
MARVKGTYTRDYNNEVVVRKPIDARSLVPTYADLITKDNWVKSGTTQVIAFNGLVVSVADTTDTTKNGVYYLFDPASTGLKAPDVTNKENWHKLSEGTDAATLVDFVTKDNLVAALDPYAKTANVVAIGEFEAFKTANDTAILEVATEVSKKADKEDLAVFYKISDADAKFAVAAEVTASLNAKADKDNTYTKSEVNEIQASLITQVNAKADAATTYTKEEVNALLDSIEGRSSESADSVARALEAYKSENDAAVLSLETRVGTAKAGEVAATGLFAKVDSVADEVAQIIKNTDENIAKLNDITSAVQELEEAIQAIPVLEVATSENLGGIKSGSGDNVVSVNDEGIAAVSTVNVNSLSQDAGDILILNGGSTSENT